VTTYHLVGGPLGGTEHAARTGVGLLVKIVDEAGQLWIGCYEYVIGSDVALFASFDLLES
jgi:hypothetical protein